MDAETAIKESMHKAKIDAIKARLLQWIDRAKDVEIVSETPSMERENCYVTASMIPTGDLTITLSLTEVEGIKASLKDGGDRHSKKD